MVTYFICSSLYTLIQPPNYTKIIILSEVSQTEKDKYHMMSLICGILKETIQMNLFPKQKERHRHRKQRGKRVGGRDKLGSVFPNRLSFYVFLFLFIKVENTHTYI